MNPQWNYKNRKSNQADKKKRGLKLNSVSLNEDMNENKEHVRETLIWNHLKPRKIYKYTLRSENEEIKLKYAGVAHNTSKC